MAAEGQWAAGRKREIANRAAADCDGLRQWPVPSKIINSKIYPFSLMKSLRALSLLSLVLFFANVASAMDKSEWSYYSGWDRAKLTKKAIELYVSRNPDERRLAATLVAMYNGIVETQTRAVVVAILLGDKSRKVRNEALLAFTDLADPEVEPLVPLAARLVNDEDPDIRRTARALFSTHPKGSK